MSTKESKVFSGRTRLDSKTLIIRDISVDDIFVLMKPVFVNEAYALPQAQNPSPVLILYHLKVVSSFNGYCF